MRKQVFNMLALLKIGDGASLPRNAFGKISHISQKRLHLAACLMVRGGQLQMIPLCRIGDTAACKKRTAHKRRTAALILQKSEVYMMDKMHRRVVAKRIDNVRDLFRICKAEDKLSDRRILRHLIEVKAKRFTE